MNRYLRKQFSPIGWGLLGLNIVMSLFVILAALPEVFRLLIEQGFGNFTENALIDAINAGFGGYYAMIILGLGVMLSLEGPRFWREELWEKREPMKPGAFFGIAAVFLGLQLGAGILNELLNAIANFFGRDILQVYEEMAESSQDSFFMFFYAGILAPIWEELLFRGWIQRRLRPFGKTFAIVFTALLFGLFHGNLAQIPFAFLAGLVLSFTAEHYSLGWCMVLHMVNNLIIADLIPRLTAYLPEAVDYAIQNGILLLCAIAGAVLLIWKRKKLHAEFAAAPMDGRVIKCFFLNPGMLAFLALMLKSCWDAMYPI